MEIPRIISVDDHVIEPPDLWQSRLPSRFADRAPRVKRTVGKMTFDNGLQFSEGDGPGCGPMDLWLYDDLTWAIPRGMAQVGHLDELSARSVTYDEMRAGLLRPGGPARRHGRQPHRGEPLLPDASRGSAGRPSSSARTRSSRSCASRPTTTG